jgi:putative protein kinase ArgK-like GTPase of G3E family
MDRRVQLEELAKLLARTKQGTNKLGDKISAANNALNDDKRKQQEAEDEFERAKQEEFEHDKQQLLDAIAQEQHQQEQYEIHLRQINEERQQTQSITHHLHDSASRVFIFYITFSLYPMTKIYTIRICKKNHNSLIIYVYMSNVILI